MENKPIYFDHAATTPLCKEAVEKMLPYMTEVFGNPNSQHYYGREAVKAVDEARDGIAKIINAKPNEVYFTSGGTEGDNWAMRGIAHAHQNKGKHLIISPIEHAAMLATAKALVKEGKSVSVILGFNTVNDVFYEDEFKALGADVFVTTVDGSKGIKGFVTDVLCDLDYSYFFTCGPMPMFKAIENVAKTSGQYSFEERMGCGFGACMGCSCKTKYENIRICKDGPVLEREVIVW